jgi:predicted glycoside hydrolase/deacetylase ChbG (UPF0249 family)
MIRYLTAHPEIDAGLHLTHTSEWKEYRWGPVAGTAVPGLLDREGAFWNNVPDVLKHATANEIAVEIDAQVQKAKLMGFSPTHLDTHMGTLWTTPEFLECYISAGVKLHVPVLYAGGHGSLLMDQLADSPLSGLSRLAGIDTPAQADRPKILAAIQKKGREIWDRGLAVVDDMYVSSYDWTPDNDANDYKTEKYKELLRSVKAGITVIMVHCTDISSDNSFQYISSSGKTRFADLLSMTNPELKKFIEDQGIILTTWRELQQRRDKVK